MKQSIIRESAQSIAWNQSMQPMLEALRIDCLELIQLHKDKQHNRLRIKARYCRARYKSSRLLVHLIKHAGLDIALDIMFFSH